MVKLLAGEHGVETQPSDRIEPTDSTQEALATAVVLSRAVGRKEGPGNKDIGGEHVDEVAPCELTTPGDAHGQPAGV